MKTQKRLLNQAHIELSQNIRSGEDRVTLDRGGEITWLNVHTDKPKAKFDLKIEDEWGNTVYEKKGMTGETNRYGERLSLPITDSYYKIKAENVEGADVLDAFLE